MTLKPGIAISPSPTVASSHVSETAKTAALTRERKSLMSGSLGRSDRVLECMKCRPLDVKIRGTSHERNVDEEAEEDHDRKLRTLLDRCREKNLKLNKDKLVFK